MLNVISLNMGRPEQNTIVANIEFTTQALSLQVLGVWHVTFESIEPIEYYKK